MRGTKMGDEFKKLYDKAIDNPAKFWQEQAGAIDWYKECDEVLNESGAPHFYRWFKGASCNTCYNAIDRHVERGMGDKTALIYDSPVSNAKAKYSYSDLLDKISKLAGGLNALGLKKGDRVIIYMPMIPEAPIAMLACARLGLIHSVVFGGFAANELATRIKDSGAKAIITASGGIEPARVIHYMPLVHEAIALAPNIVQDIVIFSRDMIPYLTKSCDDFAEHDWQDLSNDYPPHPCVEVAATDPLYILYTSGTTGQPKGVIRDNGGHMVALKWSMKNIYNVDVDDVFWAASDVGWVVGHSYIVYAPLLHGASTVMFEGKPVGTPDAGAFWRMIEEYKISTLFTAPTAFRAIRKEDPKGELLQKYNLQHFRALFLAGERCDPDTLYWAEEKLSVPVIDHWWQTETGWAIASNCLGIEKLPTKAGSPTHAVPSYDVRILSDSGAELPRGEMGAICIKLPLPPSTLPSLWKADDRFIDSYLSNFPGYYETGDAGYIDDDGYIYVMSRTDDIINVAGHRLSTGAIEEVLATHPDVAECAVIGVKDKLKGQLPMGFLVLKSGVTKGNDDIMGESVQLVRDKIGPVAAYKISIIAKRLPKTRSGKILRGIMRKIADGEEYKLPATIDDPAILDEITADIKAIGYGK